MLKKLRAKKGIIRESYIRLMLISMIVLAANNLCSFVDNIMIGRMLGTQALAAVGYFLPISVITGLCYVIILGAVVVCGNYIGMGKRDKVNVVFVNCFITITVFYVIFAAVLIVFRGPLARLLGASGDAYELLCAYISGYAPSTVFSSLCALLIALASFNNAINRSYVSTGIMFFGNGIFDLLLVRPLGIFGIGLASSISSMAAFAVLVPAYMKSSTAVHFERAPFDAGSLIEAVRRGLPALLFTGGLLVKNTLLNYTLTVHAGNSGIAVVNVLSSVCGFVGMITGGCGSAYVTLASQYYGEEDRDGITDLFSVALLNGLIYTCLVVAGLAIFSNPLARFFIEADSETLQMGQRMFRLGFLFFPINCFFSLLIGSYKVQDRMKIADVMSFAEVAMIGLIALFTVPHFGTDAAWLANLWSDLLAFAILFIWNKPKRLTLQTVLQLPEDFGASPDECFEYAIESMADVQVASEESIKFCLSKGIDRRKAYWVGLCIEEITHNILQHGAFKEKINHVYVRLVCKNELIIRVRDDCMAFNPCERMKMHNPQTPESNIGLNMVKKLATSVDYYNSSGINTLILKV